MTDPLAALTERHVPVYPPNYKANEGPSCRYDRSAWPCDARIALDAMAEVARKAATWDGLARAIEAGYTDESIDRRLWMNDPVYHAIVYEARKHRALAAASPEEQK